METLENEMEDQLVDDGQEQEDLEDAPKSEESGEEQGETEDNAPESGEPDKISFTPEQQKVFDETIAKKVAKTYEEKRRADELEARIKEMEAKLPQATRPEVPKPPDQYSDNYEQELKAYNEGIRKQAEYDFVQQKKSEYEQYQQQQTQQERQKEIEKKVSSYSERAEKLGIKKDELAQANANLSDINLGAELSEFLLDDSNGPQIVMYLAQNKALAYELSEMPSLRAVARIVGEIKPLAAKIKKDITLAPDPAEHLSGKGAPEGDGGVPGAVYE